MKNKYYIKKLWFTGPEIEDSPIEFINGLNIIHGANDTGKSWILDSFDFMCGMDYDNFVIDKSTGCDTVHMEVVTGHGTVTMSRQLGSTKINVESTDSRIETHQYTAGKSKYWINSVWMKIFGIDDSIKVIKNENASRQSLTFRSFLNLICVSLESINRRQSIFTTSGGPFSRTAMKSTLLYFLNEEEFKEYKEVTGTKDKNKEKKIRALVKNENLEYLSELKQAIKQEELSPEQVKEKISHLMSKINDAQVRLSEATAKRRKLSDESVDINEELKSAYLMKKRYQILREQYHSDIKRITFIIDGEEKLATVKAPEHCPFCGAEMKLKKQPEYAAAAQAELQRILPQLKDVVDAEKDIDQEIEEHKKRLQQCQEESDQLAQLINQDLQPAIQELQRQIVLLQESVDSASQKNIIEKIEKHLTAPVKSEDSDENQAVFKPQDNFTEEFVSDFNDLLKKILKDVNFDKFSNCYFDFDSDDFDIVVNGKQKKKYGGGYKAFLNAVVAISLHQYLSEKGKHNLGILLIDSPILSLKEGGNDTSNEMRIGLFKYLVKHQDFGQVIIVENRIPDIDYDGAMQEMFTHKETDGRYGLLIGYTE
ncbi:MAG: AAA family ATPase [Acidaminococcus sp.]|uniref:AAA family ATPase n=1 Tax=Acidaminococcus sp. TaxID=1872103 RepID=UPI0026E0CB3A|nr:AAA family ATPase [Acidaminococcus sp.]MDO5596981.1 AAA family ATPase [Acidaminococcus sp.]